MAKVIAFSLGFEIRDERKAMEYGRRASQERAGQGQTSVFLDVAEDPSPNDHEKRTPEDISDAILATLEASLPNAEDCGFVLTYGSAVEQEFEFVDDEFDVSDHDAKVQ